MQGNYIKLFRKFTKWGWYSDPNTKAVFLHILLNANWEDGELLGETIHAGECAFGRKKAAKELGLSEQNVRTALDHLRKTGEISTIKVTNRFSVLKIEKWGLYQGQEEEPNQQSNQALTKHQPSTNHIQEEERRIKKKKVSDARAREGASERYGWEVETILSYLNEKTGKRYKVTASNRKVISRALEEGYSLNDLRTVIDNQCARWLDDPDRNQYLAPALLFDSEKIERYLNSPPVGKKEDVLDFAKIAQKIRKGYSHMRLTKKEAAAIPFEAYIDIRDRKDTLSDEEIIKELKGASNGNGDKRKTG